MIKNSVAAMGIKRLSQGTGRLSAMAARIARGRPIHPIIKQDGREKTRKAKEPSTVFLLL